MYKFFKWLKWMNANPVISLRRNGIYVPSGVVLEKVMERVGARFDTEYPGGSGYYKALSLTGKGVVHWLAVHMLSRLGCDPSSPEEFKQTTVTGSIRIWVDGFNVYEATNVPFGKRIDAGGYMLIGNQHSFQPIRYDESFVVEVQCNESATATLGSVIDEYLP